ncbi:sulfotransferase [Diaphorobacter sp. HDW4A]|uniref:sulfotransferase family protein n=1 Tax=Diaphorobacter sp. HDW4A TaxID=2714924 RepID=UPI00140BA878|nr:sulfotransferase [Diaphorobacter sp. HDW4A]QIL78558.1 sulfotransferase [Diaphorobacter sp. HDW4A]
MPIDSIRQWCRQALAISRQPKAGIPQAPMPMIVGSPRSGTTLLRLMLDAHPALAIPPETGFLAMPLPGAEIKDCRAWFAHAITHFPPNATGWEDFGIDSNVFERAVMELEPFNFAEGFRLFYRMYAARFGKQRWGDKTPLYCLHMPALQKLLPEAHFIHIIRDGRGSAASLRKQWFSPGESMAVQAQFWRANVVTAREAGALRLRYLEVRYEDLITNTEVELRRLCDFIELDFDPVMLSYHERSAGRLLEHQRRVTADGVVIVGETQRRAQQVRTTQAPNKQLLASWRDDLSVREIEEFESVAGDLLRELGYAVSTLN